MPRRLLVFLLYLLLTGVLPAAQVTLTWNRSPEPDVTGYRVYRGRASGRYTSVTDVGSVNRYTVTGLGPGTYYFAITAYSANLESGFSNEVSTTIPSTFTLYYPHPVSSDSSTWGDTGFALVNTGVEPAHLTFTAVNTEGKVISEIEPVGRTLGPGSQMAVMDSELFGHSNSSGIRPAYARIDSTSADIDGFFLMLDEGYPVFSGAPMSSGSLKRFLFLETGIGQGSVTRLQISNPNQEAAHIVFELKNAEGMTLDSAGRTIGPGATTVLIAGTDLFPDIVADENNYIVATSDFGVSPFELVGDTPDVVRVLGGQSSVEGAQTVYGPLYVADSSWNTIISIVNLEPTPGTVSFRLISAEGREIASRRLPIAPFGKLRISDQDFFGPRNGKAHSGYIRIEAGDGPKLVGSIMLTAIHGDGTPAASTELPMVARAQEPLVFSHVASNDEYYTGFALVNPDDAEVTVLFDVYDADGTLLAGRRLTIPADGTTSGLLTDYFPMLVGQNRTSGYVKILGDRALAGCIVFGKYDLSFLAAINAR